MMKVTVNGKSTDIESGTSISALINTLKLESSRCVVELNGGIIKKDLFDEICLSDGDRIEIFSFVGGG